MKRTAGGPFLRKKRGQYTRQTSMPPLRLGKHPNARIYRFRRIVFTIAVLLTLVFITKTVLSFFGSEYVSLELSGNMHYTDIQIYDVLGKKLQNIVTDSEEQTATYLKENLSYIKDAYVTKHVMKRMLTIEVTERDPFALLRIDSTDGKNYSFFLVDNEGHVLKHIDKEAARPSVSEKFPDRVVLSVINDTSPKVGETVKIPEVATGLNILKTALLLEQSLARQIQNIDISDLRKIKLRLNNFQGTVWLAGDAVESGLHQVALFLKQKNTYGLELTSVEAEPEHLYLDARYEDTVYLGGLPPRE